MTTQDTNFVALMYHNVCESNASEGQWTGFEKLSPSVTGYFVDRSTFSQHCDIIAATGRASSIDRIRVNDAPTSPSDTAHDISPHGPEVLLTFDDGWRGTVDIAGPILAAHKLQAMMFVTTDLIGHPHFVSRSQLQSLPQTFAIGSHAKTHRLLAELSDQEVREELNTSKAVLEDILGKEVDTIAYPGGSFDSRVLRMTQEADYRVVFTSVPAVHSTRNRTGMIGRLAVKSGTSIDTLQRWLRGDIRREQLRSKGLAGIKRLLGRSFYRHLRSRAMSEAHTHLEMTDLSAMSPASAWQ